MTGEATFWIVTVFLVLIVLLIWLVATGKVAAFSANLRKLSLDVQGHPRERSTAPRKESPDPGIYGLVHRFKRVMAAHGMRPEHWQRFFKACGAPFSIAGPDQKDDDALLRWIDDEKVQWLCDTLLIRRDWMDGEQDADPHERFFFNKNAKAFYEAIEDDLKQRRNVLETESAKAIFALDRNKKDAEDDPDVKILMAFGIPVCRLSDGVIVYRWIYDGTQGCPWNSEPYQGHIRIIARLAHLHYNMIMYGLYLEPKDFEAIQNGDRLVPEVLATPRAHHCFWHPDDYALSPRESSVSKKSESLIQLLTYMADHGLPCAEERPLPPLTA